MGHFVAAVFDAINVHVSHTTVLLVLAMVRVCAYLLCHGAALNNLIVCVAFFPSVPYL